MGLVPSLDVTGLGNMIGSPRTYLFALSFSTQYDYKFSIRLLPELDCWNSDVTHTLDAALLCSSRAGADLGHESGLV